MSQLTEITSIKKKFQKLLEEIGNAREAVDHKRDWWEGKSETWQDSDAGQEWDAYLTASETLLEELENIDTTDLD